MWFWASVLVLKQHICYFCGRNPETARKKENLMTTQTYEYEHTEQTSRAKPVLTGLVIGGLVGAGAMLLFAPQRGERTRAEIQEGTRKLRDQATETVNNTVTQVKSKTNQIADDVKTKAQELQYQGQDLLAKQLDRVANAAKSAKETIQGSEPVE